MAFMQNSRVYLDAKTLLVLSKVLFSYFYLLMCFAVYLIYSFMFALGNTMSRTGV